MFWIALKLFNNVYKKIWKGKVRRVGIVSGIKYLIPESRSSGIGASLQISLKFSSVQTGAFVQHSLLRYLCILNLHTLIWIFFSYTVAKLSDYWVQLVLGFIILVKNWSTGTFFIKILNCRILEQARVNTTQ